MGQLFYHFSDLQKRQKLRTQSTYPEQVLWSKLRSKQVEEVKFRRQASIGNYIVDFYAPSIGLVIEVDGDSHFEGNAPKYDQKRTVFLETLKLNVIRFTNHEIMNQLDAVLETIRMTILSKVSDV